MSAEIVERERRTRHIADHGLLARLPNRLKLAEALEALLAEAESKRRIA